MMYWYVMIPLCLTTPLSSNTSSYNDTQPNEHLMTLNLPFNATQVQMSWGKLKDHI